MEGRQDLIYRQAAIDALFGLRYTPGEWVVTGLSMCVDALSNVPSAQPEIIYCKDCKYWNSGTCECREYVVNCQDYMVGDMETDAEHFCGYAERREE